MNLRPHTCESRSNIFRQRPPMSKDRCLRGASLRLRFHANPPETAIVHRLGCRLAVQSETIPQGAAIGRRGVQPNSVTKRSASSRHSSPPSRHRPRPLVRKANDEPWRNCSRINFQRAEKGLPDGDRLLPESIPACTALLLAGAVLVRKSVVRSAASSVAATPICL